MRSIVPSPPFAALLSHGQGSHRDTFLAHEDKILLPRLLSGKGLMLSEINNLIQDTCKQLNLTTIIVTFTVVAVDYVPTTEQKEISTY